MKWQTIFKKKLSEPRGNNHEEQQWTLQSSAGQVKQQSRQKAEKLVSVLLRRLRYAAWTLLCKLCVCQFGQCVQVWSQMDNIKCHVNLRRRVSRLLLLPAAGVIPGQSETESCSSSFHLPAGQAVDAFRPHSGIIQNLAVCDIITLVSLLWIPWYI